ncbi:hypothetical protein A5666_22790 [Mycolicibacterium fortuitum]|uniref:hypothetical protein n=1 Tax=Mycolicibacterium fortuitum TaxID=1766 RepID=UPI0007EBA0BA|nr:hypothetical protein [Mycolicibacterium fortuitum]OBA98273.1 hypothetical protein A5665_25710 [Mycolicibacterium fortuitum]OBI70668.1 hypothetical protein A5666_22790 [Mycolicibacterium fortuitum]
MSYTAAQLQALVERCKQFRDAKAPGGYREGLALCVIDSVQSTGVKYPSVENVVARYRDYRRGEGGDPNTDGAAELLATFDELDGPDGWSQKIGNGNRTSSRGGVLKAEAIRDAARVLAAEGIETTVALLGTAEDEERLERLRKAWCAVKGQRSGITWHYLQMLAGIPGVKPDRMICRFVADALKLPSVTTGFALEILTAAAEEMGMSPTDLDHAVWQWQRGRRSGRT